MSESVEVSVIPPCDLCGHLKVKPVKPATVDGRMAQGSWANMCDEHWMLYGCGSLGTGCGQRLVLRPTVDEMECDALNRSEGIPAVKGHGINE